MVIYYFRSILYSIYKVCKPRKTKLGQGVRSYGSLPYHVHLFIYFFFKFLSLSLNFSVSQFRHFHFCLSVFCLAVHISVSLFLSFYISVSLFLFLCVSFSLFMSFCLCALVIETQPGVYIIPKVIFFPYVQYMSPIHRFHP